MRRGSAFGGGATAGSGFKGAAFAGAALGAAAFAGAALGGVRGGVDARFGGVDGCLLRRSLGGVAGRLGDEALAVGMAVWRWRPTQRKTCIWPCLRSLICIQARLAADPSSGDLNTEFEIHVARDRHVPPVACVLVWEEPPWAGGCPLARMGSKRTWSSEA